MSNNIADGYTGSGMPDMGRKPERAGQVVEEKGFVLTYDERGYCVMARNSKWIPPVDPETEGGHWVE